MPGSLSSEPAGTTTMLRSTDTRGTAEPQRVQNAVPKNWAPGQREVLHVLRAARPAEARRPCRRRWRSARRCGPAGSASSGRSTCAAAAPRSRRRPRRTGSCPASCRASVATGSRGVAGMPNSGGYSSYCGRSSVIAYQAAFEPTNMCLVGRMPEVALEVAGRRDHQADGLFEHRRDRAADACRSRGGPARRCVARERRVSPSPAEARHGAATQVANGVPWCLRHIEQWQCSRSTNGPSIS